MAFSRLWDFNPDVLNLDGRRGGVAAKVDLLWEYTSNGPRDADDAILYAGIEDDGTECALADHAADSLWADLRRLTGGRRDCATADPAPHRKTEA